ncbi:glycoside hydrolase [Diplodia corticola]|uniref:Glycoside hydrolase n=1 Tax=Diplodia corticola TaxID=236234 RepID=A0A1J9REP0_9PEZI|nr:glycoside hydrolase [Diplodia corticola]OJD38865.1 glycoside hydrolase [Diplodia corticola]
MVSSRALALVALFSCLTYAVPYPSDGNAPRALAEHLKLDETPTDSADSPAMLVRRTTGGVVTGPVAVFSINNKDGVGAGADSYTFYRGDGSAGAGWPSKDKWVSFENMWNTNKDQILAKSCGYNGWGADDSSAEIQAIYDSIQTVATETKVDHRFILAIIVQESKGCVRVPTTGNPDPNIFNPGLMQCHSGDGTCANKNPCPNSAILQMIREGSAGTNKGDGLAQVLNKAQSTLHDSGARTFYAAAKYYNGGSIPPSNNLEDGCCTRCYASDVANRLTGWTSAATKCNL